MIPLNAPNIREKIRPVIAVLIIAGRNSATLKNPVAFSPLFNKTARNSDNGISTANFPNASKNTFPNDFQ
jgi:hypothetical protein